jgi:hypothetical protein
MTLSGEEEISENPLITRCGECTRECSEEESDSLPVSDPAFHNETHSGISAATASCGTIHHFIEKNLTKVITSLVDRLVYQAGAVLEE